MAEGGKVVPPDGGYGWVIVFASVLINITLLTLVPNFGIIYHNEFQTMGISGAETSFLLHLHSALYCSLGLLSSPLLKKYQFRHVAFFGASLMCLGFLLSSFAKSYEALVFTVSVLVGVGQGILMPATYLAINTYFKKRLTLAVSINVTGASISSVFMPLVCNKLLTRFGTQGTILILFGISLGSFVGCFLLKPLPKKKTIEDVEEKLTTPAKSVELNALDKKGESQETAQLNGKPYMDTTIPIPQKSIWDKIVNIFDLELLKNRSFRIVIIALGLSFAAELNIVLMVQFVLPELAHFPRQDVALAQSVQSIADIIGRLVIPFIAHGVNASPKVMYSVALITSTVGRTALAQFYNERIAVLFCVTLFGLGKGIKAVFQSVIIPKFVPLEKLPAATGINMIVTGVLSLIIGPVIGGIRDLGGSYIYALHAASIISMVCVVGWVMEYCWYYKKEKSTTEDES